MFYYSKKLGVIEDEELSYDRGKELIKHLNKSKDKGLKQLRNFYHKLRVLRNDLAHINIKNHKDTFNALQKSFEKFENLVIKEDVFLQKIKKA